MSTISSVTSLWDTNSVSSTTSSKAKEAFSQTVSEMQSGSKGGGSDSSSDEEQVTVQRILPDGSVLVLVMQGNEIISQTKLGASQSAAAAPLSMTHSGANIGVTGAAVNGAGNTIADRFNDTSTSIMAGSLFSEGV